MTTLWKCEGGSAVGNPADAHPSLSSIKTTVDSVALPQYAIGGNTWATAGQFVRNKFGEFGPNPDWD